MSDSEDTTIAEKLASANALITANAQLYGQQALIVQGLMNRVKQLNDQTQRQARESRQLGERLAQAEDRIETLVAMLQPLRTGAH